ncbi:hypothetical protein LDENG_00148220 [Lucifuga dentata]|nr:hypothetical protein LDENG_00148220 [Lucifuga dentata]
MLLKLRSCHSTSVQSVLVCACICVCVRVWVSFTCVYECILHLSLFFSITLSHGIRLCNTNLCINDY